jgi:type II secretory pathway pseudopilin PulG
MWAVLIVLCVTVVGGWYGWPAEQRREAVARQQAGEAADAIGLYRQAVVAWFKANDVTDTSVSLADLKQAGVLPAWSGLATGATAATWTNYRDSAGRIYIFPAAAAGASAGAPPVIAELLARSRNSLNVGIYRASDHTLWSPVDGTRIALPPLGGAVIPDAAPVWLASRD